MKATGSSVRALVLILGPVLAAAAGCRDSDGGPKAGTGSDSGVAGASGSPATGGSGCVPGAPTGGGSGSGDAGAAPANSGALPVCAEPLGSCPARSVGVWTVLLSAADLGPDTRLVAVGEQAVLAIAADRSFRVVRLRHPGAPETDPPFQAWTFPGGELRPIAIADKLGASTLAVLACDEPGTRCSLFRSEAGAQLTWQETALPAGLRARGVAIDTEVEPPAICAYGNGLLCVQKDVQEELIPQGADLQLNALAFGGQWSLAVGERGRWFKRERDASGALGAWMEQSPLGTAALTQVSVGGPGGVITGEGRIQAALGSQVELLTCAPEGEVVSIMLTPAVSGAAYALQSDGQVLQHAPLSPMRPSPYCAYQKLALPSPVLATTTARCSVGNSRVLTQQALLGTSFCPIF